MKMEAFLTGSQEYGTPTPQSDIDMVVYSKDSELIKLLREFSEQGGSIPDGAQQMSARFGKLNVLVCFTEAAYKAWEDGTLELSLKGTSTRDEAVAVFERVRAECNVEQ